MPGVYLFGPEMGEKPNSSNNDHQSDDQPQRMFGC
jgi:hypothetical protein